MGAVKYALLKNSIGSDITFDVHESINLEGNSGPYLQYTYVRIISVLKKADKIRAKQAVDIFRDIKSLHLEPEEEIILRTIIQYEEVVNDAMIHTSPNIVADYLYHLAQEFNLFYQKYPIARNQKNEFRLALTDTVGRILSNGLYLLGIQTPIRM